MKRSPPSSQPSPARGEGANGARAQTRTGKVYLVGAGPGDPELLTLKAVRVIGLADVLLVDDLVSDAILAHAKPNARIVYVGKRGGCKSTPQAFIEKLLVSEAHAGNTVVRLKGGDPFIFGRGGEEREHLHAHGVEVEVVNGITSGLAAATQLGVPLTHRDHAHGVIFVTGHGKNEEAQSKVNWSALAATQMTLVIYMGMARCEVIQAELLAGGMRADIPVAVVTRAGSQDSACAVTTLAQLSATIRDQQLASPGIIVIGDVVRAASMAALEELVLKSGTEN
ncbi:MAG: uroporphyrinogen-III C-methyltransferase [Burkholderiaceae bacterium]